MLKEVTISFRALPEERQQLEELVKRSGQKSMSEVLRELVRGATASTIDTGDLQPVATLNLKVRLQNA